MIRIRSANSENLGAYLDITLLSEQLTSHNILNEIVKAACGERNGFRIDTGM